MDFSKLISLLKISDWLKLSTRYIFTIVLISSFLIFAPSETIRKFDLENITNKYKSWISIVFLFSLLLLVTDLIIVGKNTIVINWKKFQKNKYTKKRILNLNQEEKSIIIYYFINKTRSQVLSISDGTVAELESSGLIYRSSILGSYDSFPYNIQPWVQEYIHKNITKVFNNDELVSIDSDKFS